MRSPLAFLFVALVLSLAAAQTIWVDSAFKVDSADQVCRSATDCSHVASSCCSGSSCETYQAVSVSALPKYEALLQAYISANCTAVLCTANVCAAPTLTCATSSAGDSVCQITRPTADPCPPNVAQVQCLADPCSTATCPNNADATCRANYCGGCNAEFFNRDGVKVDCSIIDPCNGLPVVQCFADPCATASCPADPTATCQANYCGGCNFEFVNARGEKVDCAPKPTDPCNGIPVSNCLVDPCSTATCAADPTATCEANYCGGCNAEFFNRDGVKVDCVAKPGPEPCIGLPVVDCFADPCSTTKCPADLTATCRANYCGGCNVEFFDARGNKVDCNAVTDPICPEGIPLVNCMAQPCAVTRCENPAFVGAQCRDNYCGGCNAEYLVDGVWKACEGVTPCDAAVQPVSCFAEPCATAKCDAYPNAVCENDYCGGCSAVFKVDGRVVECGVEPPVDHTVCPPGVPEVQCFADPCSVTDCPAYPNAQCKSDYCGGCRAIFTVEDRLVNCDASCLGLSCDQCTANPNCKFCSGQYSTLANLAVVESLGFCVAATGATENICTASNSRLLAAGSVCPPVPSRPIVDHTPVQDFIDGVDATVRDRFIIVISLMLNESNANPRGLHVVKMFINLIGTATPTDLDKVEVCAILKTALAQIDRRVVSESLQCSLDEQIAVKRDVQYVAALTFPGSISIDNDSSATSQLITVSVALIALASAI